jgi:hypothetical protein
MGSDTPLAVLSERPQLLFRYFAAVRAGDQPPIDQIREETVMSLVTCVGGGNLLEETPGTVPHAQTAVFETTTRGCGAASSATSAPARCG